MLESLQESPCVLRDGNRKDSRGSGKFYHTSKNSSRKTIDFINQITGFYMHDRTRTYIYNSWFMHGEAQKNQEMEEKRRLARKAGM